MIDAPDLTLADVLAREAGPPHVAMALGMEPVIEAPCPTDWHYLAGEMCRPVLLTLPKLPTVPQEPAGAPWVPASGWTYPDNWRRDSVDDPPSSPVLGGVSAWGGWFRRGRVYGAGDRRARRDTHRRARDDHPRGLRVFRATAGTRAYPGSVLMAYAGRGNRTACIIQREIQGGED